MKLELNDAMLSVIDRGLQELPFRMAAPVISELNRQIAEAKQTPEPPLATGNAGAQEMLASR